MSESSEPSGGAASLPRRPTGDPTRFLIPAEQLPPGFAERVAEPIASPPAPHPAATVVLVRQGEAGVEALLLRRPTRSSFAGGAWVFPGGRVDPGDAAVDLDAEAVGPSGEQWAGRLGVPAVGEAAGYVVAALREAWEETGILLAEGPGPLPPLAEARRTLLAGRLSLAEFLRRRSLRLDTRDLLYIAHWITPEPEPRRFDTRFFLARVAPGTRCELEGEELTESVWMPPAEAVERAREGTMTLLPPTVHTLQRLAGDHELDDLWRRLRDAPVPAFLPRMRPHPAGVMIEIE